MTQPTERAWGSPGGIRLEAREAASPRRNTAMLSRVADSLYWMGRYLERADHVARQLDVHLTIVPEQAVEAARRRRNRLIACLVRPDYPPAAVHSDHDLAYLLTFDEDNPSSIVRCIASGRENARQVREQINSQMWEQINQLYLQMQMSSMTQIWVGQPHSFYHGINQDVYRFQGITDSRITRDQGWHFVQLGRYIERASEVADMLNVDFRELYASPASVCAVTDDRRPADVPRLGGAAARCGSLRSIQQDVHRQCATAPYRRVPAAQPVISLLRAFCHQCRAAFAGGHRRRDRNAQGGARLSAGGQAAGHARLCQVDEIMESGLGAYLLDIQARCAEIHDAIYATYITYPIADKLNREQ